MIIISEGAVETMTHSIEPIQEAAADLPQTTSSTGCRTLIQEAVRPIDDTDSSANVIKLPVVVKSTADAQEFATACNDPAKYAKGRIMSSTISLLVNSPC